MLAGEIQIHDWQRGESLRAFADLNRPPLNSTGGDRQLDYIARYIEKSALHPASERALLVEPHYIDRDFLEDCGAFYVQNLEPPRNYCRRLHFFACNAEVVKTGLSAARNALREGDQSKYDSICRNFSDSYYLGFTILRPLPGCPVGRTVLRCHCETPPTGRFKRILSVTRDYHAHVAGIDLTVRGLAFQQQDRAVSACATVAIWSAFHRLRQTDEISAPSPSRITRLATQYALPFGRSMPAAEGLNISQMCVAIELLQMSPTLMSFSHDDHEYCKQAVWSAARSGYPAILILQRLGQVDERMPESRRLTRTGGSGSGFHAVTIIGVKQRDQEVAAVQPLVQLVADGSDIQLYRAGQRVESIYIHDDRIGPYRRADLVDRKAAERAAPLDAEYLSSAPSLRIRALSHSNLPVFEYWSVRYLLLPLHPRLRVGIADLDRFSLQCARNVIVPLIAALNQSDDFSPAERAGTSFTIDYWIERGHKYQERALSEHVFSEGAITRICNHVGFPRHVGVLRFQLAEGAKGTVDVLLDTTSSVPNEHFLLAIGSPVPPAMMIASELAETLNCATLS